MKSPQDSVLKNNVGKDVKPEADNNLIIQVGSEISEETRAHADQ